MLKLPYLLHFHTYLHTYTHKILVIVLLLSFYNKCFSAALFEYSSLVTVETAIVASQSSYLLHVSLFLCVLIVANNVSVFFFNLTSYYCYCCSFVIRNPYTNANHASINSHKYLLKICKLSMFFKFYGSSLIRHLTPSKVRLLEEYWLTSVHLLLLLLYSQLQYKLNADV